MIFNCASMNKLINATCMASILYSHINYSVIKHKLRLSTVPLNLYRILMLDNLRIAALPITFVIV